MRDGQTTETWVVIGDTVLEQFRLIITMTTTVYMVTHLRRVSKVNNCSKSVGTDTKQWHFLPLALDHVVAEHAVEVPAGRGQHHAVRRETAVIVRP